MELIQEIFGPESIHRNPVCMSLLIGFACPLVGVYLVLRRLVFLGVALPQISACGIACAFALHTWGIIPHLEEDPETILAFLGSTVFTLLAISGFTLLERRGGYVEGRIGTIYVLAGAWSILLLVLNPHGDHGLEDRLKGQIIAVADHDLIVTTIAFAVVMICLLLFRKELLLVSFDREMALSLGKSVAVWDGLLFLLIGIAVSMSVLSVGPLVTFGFLVLPPLMARLLATNMLQFALLSSGIGGIAAFAGYGLALRWDLPVGPTDVALLGAVYLMLFVGAKAARLLKRSAGSKAEHTPHTSQ